MAVGSRDVRSLTGEDQDIRWNAGGPLGTPAIVTYAFSTRKPDYDTESRPDFKAFGSAHKKHIRESLEVWGKASGLSFVEVPESAGGQIRFAMQNMDGMENAKGGPVSGFAFYPSIGFEFMDGDWSKVTGYMDVGGDVFMNVDEYADSANSLAPGTDGFSILLHEIGHALGFKHPFEGTPTIDPDHDNGAYTVMSYDRDNASRLGSIDLDAVRLYYGTRDLDFSFSRKKLAFTIDGRDGGDTIAGTELADTIRGLGGADVLYGGTGRDRLDGGSGNDSLFGGAGDDLLTGSKGKDSFHGGEGDDTVSYEKSGSGVVIDLETQANNRGDANGDRFDSIEIIVASSRGDRVTGSWNDDAFMGGGGKDVLSGAFGRDELTGNANDDTLIGGGGHDILIGGNGNDILEGGSDGDKLQGGKGADRFVFRSSFDLPEATAKRQEVIVDLRRSEGDKIKLKPMDADPFETGNQAFSFIGKDRFSGDGGEVRFEQKSSTTYVYGSLYGTGTDFTIKLKGSIALEKTDFVL